MKNKYLRRQTKRSRQCPSKGEGPWPHLITKWPSSLINGNNQMRTQCYYSFRSGNSHYSFWLHTHQVSNLMVLFKEKSCGWTYRMHQSTWQVDFCPCKLCKWPSCFLHLVHLVNIFVWISFQFWDSNVVTFLTCHKVEWGLDIGPWGISSKHLVRLFQKVNQLCSLGSPSNFRGQINEKHSTCPSRNIYRRKFFYTNKYELCPLWTTQWRSVFSPSV